MRISGPGRRRLPQPASFGLLAVALVGFLAASSAPSPLYVVYQQRWGFSAGTLTLIFATYVLALLATLVTVGALSDYIGRRPVLVAALLLETGSMLLFAAAGSVAALFAARIVQGVATGAAAGALSAALIEHAPPHNPRLGALFGSAATPTGLACGALLSGALVQYAPAPRMLIFAVLTGLFVLLAAFALALPEVAPHRSGALASLRPAVRVPRPVRRSFVAVVPALVSTWALGGLTLSLGPSLVATVFQLHNHFVGGLFVATVPAATALGNLVTRNLDPRAGTFWGSLGLAAGTALIVVGLDTESVPLFFLAAALAGIGFGAAFLGAFRTVGLLASPQDRAEMFAASYTVSYLALSVPAVVAGILVPHVGLRPTANVYGAGVVVLAVVSSVAARPRRAVPSAAAIPLVGQAQGCELQDDDRQPAS